MAEKSLKNLIIGGCSGYNKNHLKPWVLSINEVCKKNVDKVMVVGQASDETVEWLKENNFTVVRIPNLKVPIHVARFFSIYDYMKDHWEEYEFVVTTDVKDVYFQSDPFEELYESFFQGYNFLVASEGLQYKDEPWGNDNLMQTYGPYIYELFKNKEIYNVGTFGGTSEYVKDMVFNIFTNAINRPIPICDQAVFNVLINTQPFKDMIWPTNDWACELGTVMDPTKIEQFRPKLLFSEPIFQNGLVTNKKGRIFPIVHQYDRVPEIKKFVMEKYGQEDESQYFTYRV